MSIPAAQFAKFFNPNNALSYWHLGNAYKDNKKYDLAILNLKKAIKLSPSLVEPYFVIGDIYLSEKQYDLAIQSYSKAPKIHARPASFAFKCIGDAYKAKEDYNNAIKFYKKAISLTPDIPVPYFSLGKLYLEQKNYKETNAICKRLQQFSPKEKRDYCLNMPEMRKEYKQINEYCKINY